MNFPHPNSWWRAPEVMVNWEQYNNKLDVWSVGCIMAQLVRLSPLFPGTDYPDQVRKIIAVTGTPTEQELNELCQEGMFLTHLTHHFSGHEQVELGCRSPVFHPERSTKSAAGRLSSTVSHVVRAW